MVAPMLHGFCRFSTVCTVGTLDTTSAQSRHDSFSLYRPFLGMPMCAWSWSGRADVAEAFADGRFALRAEADAAGGQVDADAVSQ